MTERIYLHVGHGKTGSSYLQSCLALSIKNLRAYGIMYPLSSRDLERATSGLVTSGNIYPDAQSVEGVVELLDGDDGKSLLLSSEALFRTLFRNVLTEIRGSYPRAEISVLLFLRNPLSNAASSFQEFVKQGKTDKGFSSFLEKFQKPLEVANFLEACRLHAVNLTVYNFSAHKDRLRTIFCDWLRVPDGTLEESKISRVNRSLTPAEIVLMQHMRSTLGPKNAAVLGKALCQRAPNVRSEPPTAPRAELETFLARMVPQTERVHQLLGKSIYTAEELTPYLRETEPLLSFTEEQIKIIAQVTSSLLRSAQAARMQLAREAEDGHAT
jgi:hypothetical protein